MKTLAGTFSLQPASHIASIILLWKARTLFGCLQYLQDNYMLQSTQNHQKKTVAVQNPKKNPLRNIQLLCTVFTIQIYIRIDMLILNSVFLPIYSIFKAKAIFRLKETLVREKKVNVDLKTFKQFPNLDPKE